MNTIAAGRQIAIFCHSGPTPAVSTASVASSRGGRELEQVGDAVAGGHQRVVGRLDSACRREDARRHQAPPERPSQPALVVVAGLDADRRRVQADEQQPIAQRRQVGQRLDRRPFTDDRGQVPTRARVDG